MIPQLPFFNTIIIKVRLKLFIVLKINDYIIHSNCNEVTVQKLKNWHIQK